VGIVLVAHIIIDPIGLLAPALIPAIALSTYNLVVASVFRVGAAKFIIFYEFRDKDPVGAVILLSVVVFR
jgi:hypothetical protein